ncbi:hypothetical protein J1P26_17345 [Neobacillus sp. MM2021_6]|uniref:hypothetical protein n=1 Tax=Bacillaceae TaxID=186817 RepID=UPI00140977C8|nr:MULTISPECIES: hypothetical protein [Bacillaceae]MBO0961474.1 hypothetical protein [Neobacillus sp. MM2021_6]NHC19578.1 hypothetical protein [Bacillus sp. MM2020_4]
MAKSPKTGMIGIWSSVSKQFVFGIQEPTKSKAIRKIKEKIGHDWAKYRFITKNIHDSHAHMFRQGLIYKDGDK